MLCEVVLVDPGDSPLGLQVDALDRRSLILLTKVHLGDRPNRFGGMPVLGKDVAERHREARCVCRSDQLLGVGALSLLEAGENE